MTSHIETERRFLIKLPLSQEAAEAIMDKADAPAHIVQMYLKQETDWITRVRMVTVEMWGKQMIPHFTMTSKRHIAQGINEETPDAPLTIDSYNLLLSQVDPAKQAVEKTRYFVTWAGKLFELDIFHGVHEGLAILEIELTDMSESFELPPFLEVVREITNEKEYSNVNLATRKN